jgi:branched-chain amino acid transport system substrate-binding protein
MTRAKKLSLMSGLLAAALCTSTVALAEEGVTKDTIIIGGMGPLTGPLAMLVNPALHGIEAVFEETNDAGGINGRKIVYKLEDDECQPSKGVGAVKKLIYEVKPFMIVGGGCSNASIAQRPEIIAAKIPWLIVASTADQLTEPANPYIYTSMLAAWMEVYGMLQHALDQGKTKIGVIWQGDAWGKARIEPMRQALKSKGIEAVAIEEVAIEPTDLTPTVLKMQQAGADAVMLLLFPKAAIPYLRDAYKFGYQPLTVGGSPLAEIDVMAKGVGSDDAVKNLRAVSPSGYSTNDPQAEKWKAIIEKRFPNDRFSTIHLFGISAGQFVVEALRRVGPDLTRAGLLDVLSNIEYQTETYAGPMRCTPDDHQCHKTLGIFALKDGKVVAVGKATPAR